MESVQLDDSERFVITAYEYVTPLGHDKKSSWLALASGQHGFKPTTETRLATHPELGILKSQVAGAIQEGFEAKLFEDPVLKQKANYKELKHYSHLSAQVAAWTVYRAMKEAGALQKDSAQIDPDIVDPYRTDLYVGSTFAGVGHIADIDTSRVRSTDLPQTMFGRVASVPANLVNIRRRALVVDTECSSGTTALEMAVDALQKKVNGKFVVDMAVAAGVDAGIPPRGLALFEGMGGDEGVDTRTDPEVVSRPFDADRQGLIMGEGGGALVIERLKDAKERGLTDEQIYAEIVATVSYTHAASRVQAGEEGALRGLEELLERSGLSEDEWSYLNGHATSTGIGDSKEARISRQAVSNRGINPKKMYANSTKGATGHCLGGAGAIEAGFALDALLNGIVPPALKLENPLEDIAIFNNSALTATEANLDVVYSISLGFGGSFAGIALRKYLGR